MDFDLNEGPGICSGLANEEENIEQVQNIVGENTSTQSEGCNIKDPYVGMEFNSYTEAMTYYKNYAKFIGFGISTKASRRSKVTKEFIDVKYACTRYGKKRESNATNPRPCLKIDCQATLHVNMRQDGKWIVQNFIKEHNHELFPNHAYYFPCHRDITWSQKNDISTLNSAGVRTSQIYTAMAKQHGGYEKIGCLEKDVRNYLYKQRRLGLESGDANAMMEYFVQMKDEDPNFFYAVDFDDEDHLRNVFWVHGQGRDDYRFFGEVVSFDTTYITNKYKMPFAPFIGVNNHFQSTIFGCALLADETSQSFIWLMETWLRAMDGKAPDAIITDQDNAMKVAIKKVLPHTRHRYCLWHILRKLPEKLGYVIRKYENFMSTFNRCIYQSWTVSQFEERWWKILEEFELAEDGWIQSIYEDREFWVPTYLRNTFFAGMSTTQRSESINSFFDKYVNKKTTLKEFIDKYMRAIQDRNEAESHANFSTLQKEPVLKSPSLFEKQMSSIYTHEIFKKFQVEVLGASGCYPTKQEDGLIQTFKVQDFEKHEEFMVEWDLLNKKIVCLCRSFEFNGFLCRHSLCVLHHLGVFQIPSCYILKRWTKDVRSNFKANEVLKQVINDQDRYHDLFNLAILLSKEGSLSHESYEFVSNAMRSALEQSKAINSSIENHKRFHYLGGSHKENINGDSTRSFVMLDPQISKTKGAPKRMKSGIENGRKKKKKQVKKIHGAHEHVSSQ